MIDRKKAADRSLKNGMDSVTGVDVLAVTAANINDYACGSWALIMRDVDQLLASHSAEVLAVLESAQVPHAFRLRRELVSMKKCAFFLHEQGCTIERQLTQLATFFHNEHQQEPDRPGWRHSDRLTELSDARMQCAGACKATFDGRAIAKLICSLPRHPEKKRPETLDTLPNSLHSFRVAAAAAAAAEYGLLTPAPSRLKRLHPVTCAGAGCGGVADVAAVICVASQLPSCVFLFHFFMETGAWWTLSLLSTMNVRWLSCFFRIEQDSYVQSCS